MSAITPLVQSGADLDCRSVPSGHPSARLRKQPILTGGPDAASPRGAMSVVISHSQISDIGVPGTARTPRAVTTKYLRRHADIFALIDSYVSNERGYGHEVKSQTLTNGITDNRIHEGPTALEPLLCEECRFSELRITPDEKWFCGIRPRGISVGRSLTVSGRARARPRRRSGSHGRTRQHYSLGQQTPAALQSRSRSPAYIVVAC